MEELPAIVVEKLQELKGHRECIYSLAPGFGPGTFFSGAGDGWVVQWDLQNPEKGKLIARLPGSVYALEKVHKSHTLLAGHNKGQLHWLDVANQTELRQLNLKRQIFSLCLVDDIFLVGQQDGYLTVTDINARRSLSVQVAQGHIRSIAARPATGEVALGASDNIIRLYKFPGLEKLTEWEAHQNSVFSLCWSDDGETLYSGSRDAHLKGWCIDEKKVHKQTAALPAHLFTINSIALHPGGKWLATASRDKTVKLWQQEPLKLVKVIDKEKFDGHFHSVNKVIWLDEETLVSAGDDKRIIAWRVNLG